MHSIIIIKIRINHVQIRHFINSKLFFQILNVLAIERGFIVQYEPKMSGIPSKPGTSDFRYIIVYPMVKRHRENKS